MTFSFEKKLLQKFERFRRQNTIEDDKESLSNSEKRNSTYERYKK